MALVNGTTTDVASNIASCWHFLATSTEGPVPRNKGKAQTLDKIKERSLINALSYSGTEI